MLWHLSPCCALRTCSNILLPSTHLSLQLLSLSLTLSLPKATFCHLLMLLMSHGGRGDSVRYILSSLHLLSSAPPSFYPLHLLSCPFWVLWEHSRSWSRRWHPGRAAVRKQDGVTRVTCPSNIQSILYVLLHKSTSVWMVKFGRDTSLIVH